MEGHIIIKTIFIGPLNYVKQIAIGRLWDEGLVALQCFRSLKKGTSIFNLRFNEPLNISLMIVMQHLL